MSHYRSSKAGLFEWRPDLVIVSFGLRYLLVSFNSLKVLARFSKHLLMNSHTIVPASISPSRQDMIKENVFVQGVNDKFENFDNFAANMPLSEV